MKSLKKTLLFAVLLSALALAAALSASAVEINADEYPEVEVTLDGARLGGQSRLVEETTVVPFRAFVDEISDGTAQISWDDAAKTASAEWEGITVTATLGNEYITANGRVLPCGTANTIEDGRMKIAVRALAAVFCADVKWIDATKSVEVGKSRGVIASADEYYDADELYWLSRIISAEARGEPMAGKIAVGTVIYNRVESKDFPDTVYDVIFDMKHGVQFTPAATGSVYNEPTEESVIAAKLCMEGKRYRADALFFCAVAIKDTSWAGNNREYIETIGGHVFFA